LRRTQIYLDKKIIKLLARLAVKTGKTRSELIRDALQEVYARTDVKTTINKIVGLQSFADFELSQTESKLRTERQWL